MYIPYDGVGQIRRYPSIGDTYSKIIELTYHGDTKMFEDIESYIESRVGYRAFNRNLLITINRFDRLDTTFPLIRGKFDKNIVDYDSKSDRLLRMLSTSTTCVSDLHMAIDDLDRLIISDLNRMVRNIQDIDNDPIRIATIKKTSQSVRRIASAHLDRICTGDRVDLVKLNSYSKEIVERFSRFDFERGTVDIFTELWSLSLILPLHMWILRAMIDTHFDNSHSKSKTDPEILYVLGEYDKTEIEFLCFGDDDLDISLAIREEYTSHSLLFVLSNNAVYPYDPDDVKPIDKDIVLGRNILPGSIVPPIQDVTDDIYCIFHSLFGMIDMVNIHADMINNHTDIDIRSESNESKINTLINRFEKYQNRINNKETEEVSQMVGSRVSDLLCAYPPKK